MMWIIGLLAGLGMWLLGASAGERRLRALAGRATAPEHRRSPRQTPEQRAAAAVAVVDRAAELLRVGMPAPAVMSHLAELAADDGLSHMLVRISRSLELGDPPHLAVRRHLDGLSAPIAEVFEGMAKVWYVAEVAGAPAADMLARYATTCREQADSERDRATALAGPRATVQVLTWLPILSLGLGLLIGADLLSLLGSPVGALSLGAGAVLLVVGRIWMRAMLDRAA